MNKLKALYFLPAVVAIGLLVSFVHNSRASQAKAAADTKVRHKRLVDDAVRSGDTRERAEASYKALNSFSAEDSERSANRQRQRQADLVTLHTSACKADAGFAADC